MLESKPSDRQGSAGKARVLIIPFFFTLSQKNTCGKLWGGAQPTVPIQYLRAYSSDSSSKEGEKDIRASVKT